MNLYDIEEEQHILNLIMCDDRVWPLIEWLEPKHFYNSTNQVIFNVILDEDKNGSVDLANIRSRFYGNEAILNHLTQSVDTAARYFSPEEPQNLVNLVKKLWTKRQLQAILQKALSDINNPNLDPDNEIIPTVEASLFSLTKDVDKVGYVSATEAATRVINRTKEKAHKIANDIPMGIPTGLLDLDDIIGGFENSNLYVLGGRPGQGKTSLANNIAFRTAFKNPTLIFSMEMSAEQLMMRNFSSFFNVPAGKIGEGQCSPEEIKEFERFRDSMGVFPFHIDESGSLDIMTLCKRARNYKRRHDIQLIVIDHLQFMQGTKAYKGNKVQEISEISGALKALAKELDIPIILLSQLNRDMEKRQDKSPSLADLRDSGSIEQDADVVIFVYEESNPPLRDNYIIVAKNRHGKIGKIKVEFDKATTTFICPKAGRKNY